MVRILRWIGWIVLSAIAIVAITLVTFRLLAHARESTPRDALMPPGARHVRAGDIDMLVQEAGPPTGRIVVLVHGTGAWSESWRDTIDALARRGYRVIAVDLPPFGLSDRPRAENYATSDQGKRIAAALDTLEVREAVLVGHSFGARATVEAVLLSPSRVRALVLVDPALGLDASAAPPSAAVAWLLRNHTAREMLVAALATNPAMTRWILKQFTARHEVLTDQRIAVYQLPVRSPGSTEAIGAWLEDFLMPGDEPASARPAAYATLSIPTLLLWGELDTVTPIEQGKRIAKLMPSSKLEILRGVGHIPQIEDAAAFNTALLAFLASLGK